jgi:hypothetical protein
MARHPQSWLHSTLNVWLGYFLTAIAAIPASAVGLFLIRSGIGRQPAILISIGLAVLGGFAAEQVLRWKTLGSTPEDSLLLTAGPTATAIQISWGMPPVAAATLLVFVVTSPASQQRTTAFTAPEATSASAASLLFRIP